MRQGESTHLCVYENLVEFQREIESTFIKWSKMAVLISLISISTANDKLFGAEKAIQRKLIRLKWQRRGQS